MVHTHQKIAIWGIFDPWLHLREITILLSKDLMQNPNTRSRGREIEVFGLVEVIPSVQRHDNLVT